MESFFHLIQKMNKSRIELSGGGGGVRLRIRITYMYTYVHFLPLFLSSLLFLSEKQNSICGHSILDFVVS